MKPSHLPDEILFGDRDASTFGKAEDGRMFEARRCKSGLSLAMSAFLSVLSKFAEVLAVQTGGE